MNIPLSDDALCRNCQALSKNDRIIYATAELTGVEYENGILAMEFCAPTAGEVIVQLTSEPSGPYLAGGKPMKFDWDSANMRARLPIPAGQGTALRTRIGLALQASGCVGVLRRLQAAGDRAGEYGGDVVFLGRDRGPIAADFAARSKSDQDRGCAWRIPAKDKLQRGSGCRRGARRSCATSAGSRRHPDGTCARCSFCGRRRCASGRRSRCITERSASWLPSRR